MTVVFDANQKPKRRCAECQLCCRLLPMKADSEKEPRVLETTARMVQLGMLTAAEAMTMEPDFDKPASIRCKHQKHHKGCAIYSRRPFGCRMWSCVWLVDDSAVELSRPDHSHVVVDISPDYVTRTDDDGKDETIPVVQVWCDARYPNAHRAPALRAYLDRRGKEGYAALIRLSSKDAFVLFPPSMTGGEWIEKHSNKVEGEHTVEDKLAALGEYKVVIQP